MKILTEASGSLTSNYIIKAIQEAGFEAVGSDISEFNHAKVLCNDFIVMPKVDDEKLWEKTLELLKKHKVDAVLPSFDETMLEWAERAEFFKQNGITVFISEIKTIEIFQDKWNTYKFFNSIGIDTPKTSLDASYELIKPRLGRGGSGIFTNTYKDDFKMDGNISQERVDGVEYTVDVFFDYKNKPIYIVPRKRIDVKDGKSTKGVVVKNERIDEEIKKIASQINFRGAINFQLFLTSNGEIVFIEINPRIAGGMALGFASTENWIKLMVDNLIYKKNISPKKVQYGMNMFRYYDEVFI